MIDAITVDPQKSDFLYTYKSVLEERGLCLIKGCFEKTSISQRAQQIRDKIDHTKDTFERNAYVFGMDNFQRRDIGLFPAGDNEWRGRLARRITQFQWCGDTVFGPEIEMMIDLRDEYYGYEHSEGRYYINGQLKGNIASVWQYPRGGGFFNVHQDFNAVTCISKRGQDYATGGLFYVLNGQQFDIEEHLELGDMLIHLDDKPHGIASIDRYEPLDMNSSAGRLSLALNHTAFEEPVMRINRRA